MASRTAAPVTLNLFSYLLLLSYQNKTKQLFMNQSYKLIIEQLENTRKKKTFKIKISLNDKTWEIRGQSVDIPSRSFPFTAATVILLQMAH